ncbi:MAG: HNH endonuclease [Planctomycetales bacterium]|nr:HNH endonuclease [Planctomycetales bacterium]
MSVYIPAELRRRVRAHFLQRCAYCQTSEGLTVVTFEFEHIQPLSHGGQTDFENLCLACPTCNRHKANRVIGLTDEGIETRLFHPQRDSWLAHFDWSVNSTVIVGLTEVGVATVNLLRMNRPQLVEVRSLWGIVGKHPPN